MSLSAQEQAVIGPVAVGGMGGSGTRLIAQILKELGYFIGSDLGKASDNLWFTLLFKRPDILSVPDGEFGDLVDLFVRRMKTHEPPSKGNISTLNCLARDDRPQHNAAWLKKRADTFIRGDERVCSSERWGWKEPNTHVVLDRLHERLPAMRYIHVARNGLDMAYSSNQNQLKIWGERFLNGPIDVNPHHSLKYWCAMHRRVIDIGRAMGERQFLLVNYDNLCTDPINELKSLLEFLGADALTSESERFAKLVNPPSSLGRYKSHCLDSLDAEDIAYVEKLGFDTSTA